jgi:hypothetical protein
MPAQFSRNKQAQDVYINFKKENIKSFFTTICNSRATEPTDFHLSLVENLIHRKNYSVKYSSHRKNLHLQFLESCLSNYIKGDLFISIDL